MEPYLEWVKKLGKERYQTFLDAGYRPSNDTREDISLLQKDIRDESGSLLYFIDVWVVDWTKYRDRFPSALTFSPEVNFNVGSDQEPTFKVSLHYDKYSGLKFIEEFFAEIYLAMNCQPYD